MRTICCRVTFPGHDRGYPRDPRCAASQYGLADRNGLADVPLEGGSVKQSYPPMKDLPWWAKPTPVRKPPLDMDKLTQDVERAAQRIGADLNRALEPLRQRLRQANQTPRSPDSGRSDNRGDPFG